MKKQQNKKQQIITAIKKFGLVLTVLLSEMSVLYASNTFTDPIETSKNSNTAKYYTAKQEYGIIGVNAQKKIDNPSDNFFTVEIPNDIKKDAVIWLHYELKGISSFTGISRQINDELAMGGFVATNSKDWSVQKEAIAPSLLKKGKNIIKFGLPKNADYGYEIKNLQIVVAPASVQTPILITALTKIEGIHKTYIRGVIRSKEASLVQIGEQTIPVSSGAFEVFVDTFETANLKVTEHSGKVITQKIAISDARIQKADYLYDIEAASKTTFFNFSQQEKGVFTTENVSLEVEKGALLSETKNISITPLRAIDRIALDFGMTSTTKGEGYRFLPHGTHFKEEGALVKMKYDRTKIPSGYTEDDIRTYYFDTKTGHWIALERKEINKEAQYIISETTHFTDMINGVIKTPESPESTGYSPTTISGIKAADPSAKINLIQPPSANGTGSANVSYPIEVPPGRKGMQPNLAIQYNSDGGNGWLGNGWDLSVPSISVETRWGVPLYDTETETETYNFQGAMLAGVDNGKTFVAHKGDEVSREGDRQFYKRIGGGFERIIRKGDSPDDYYWEVTDKSGTQYSYGGVGSLDTDAVLRDPETGNIAQWLLVEIRDTNGNFVRYEHETETNTILGSLVTQSIYCKEITYTGYNNSEGPYKVAFERDNSIAYKNDGQKTRIDQRFNANYGFLVLNSDDALHKIKVTYNNETVRSYQLYYKEGAFHKTLLDKIEQYDAVGNLFNEHTLEYYDDVDIASGYTPFKSEENWVTTDNNESDITGGLLNPLKGTSIFSDKIPALGGGKTVSFGGSVFTGIGAPILDGTKSFSVGASFGYSNSTSKGKIAMVDIDGDGLPDKVVDDGGTLYYLPNNAEASTDGSVTFGEAVAITGISDFSKSKSSGFSGGAKATGPYGITATVVPDINKSTSKTTTYFSDVNSDGLIDVVKDGTVYFNHSINSEGKLEFKPTSAGTPSPINGGGVIDTTDTDITDEEREIEISNNPLHDVVRIWKAPYDGSITIDAPVNLIAPVFSNDLDEAETQQEQYELTDGVHVTIQRNNAELWDTAIEKGDFGIKTPTGTTITVSEGDLIYFRVQSGKELSANGDFDQVNWNPKVSYNGLTNYVDYNGKETLSSSASESSLFCESSGLTISPVATAVRIEGLFEKPATTDAITVRIISTTKQSVDPQDDTYNTAVLFEQIFSAESVVSEIISLNDIPFSTQQETPTNITFEIVSDTQVDWQALKWIPELIATTEVTINGSIESVENTILGVVSKNVLTKNVFRGAPYTVLNEDTAAIEVIPNLQFANSFTTGSSSVVGEAYAAVKQNGKLLQKYNLTIVKGAGVNSYQVQGYTSTIIKNLSKGDEIWVEFSIPETTIVNNIIGNTSAVYEKEITVDAQGNETILPINLEDFPYSASSVVYTTQEENRFGSLYGNWGQFSYNAMDGRADAPINESLLKFPEDDSTESDPREEVLIVMSSNAEKQRWDGYDPETYILGATVSSSRLGLKNVILTNPLKDLATNIVGGSEGTGAFGVTKISKSSSTTFMAGIAIFNASTSTGDSETQTDFMDMNGDGYPDILTKNMIQYTNSRGGFSGKKSSINNIHFSKNSSVSIGIGGSPIPSKSPNSGGSGTESKAQSGEKSTDQAKNNSSFSPSIGDSSNNDATTFTFQDVNGDGLVDKIDGKEVSINTGYGFLSPITWNTASFITDGESSYQNAGLGFDIGSSSFSGGIGLNRGDNTLNTSLMDVNGDGLPDRVTRSNNSIFVGLNTGLGFKPQILWQGIDEINKSSSSGESVNASFTITIPLVPPVVVAKLTINPSVNAGQSANRNLTMLNDVDGDGFLDFLTSDSHDGMTVKRSTIRNTNRLKTVINPIGGSFEIAYERSNATFDHPRGKWVMESVVLKDGITDDGPDMKTVFDYQEGKFDRHERAFLGFGKVLSKSIDTNNGGIASTEVYRVAEQEFDVSTYYKQGNLLVSQLKDADDNVYTKNENEYYNYSLLPTNDSYAKITTLNTESGIGYYPMEYTKLSSFEGGSEGVTLQESVYEYGSYGEVANYKYTDKGNLKTSNFTSFNYKTTISYQDNINDYIVSLPTQVRVADASGTLFRKTAASYDGNGNTTEVSTTLNTANETSVVDLTYDKYGNITKRTMPENHNGERMFYEYDYESDLHTYVEKIEDAFGYHTRFEAYDYRFGQLLESEDVNGFFINYEIDAVGRTTKVTGPKEHEAGVDYTIKFSYFPNATFNNSGEITQPAYAVTEHYDPQHVGDNLETVTFIDGMARAIQVKKEGVISETSDTGGAPTDEEVFIVSGRMKYDAFGRAVENYYPTSQEKASKTEFSTVFDNITPSKSVYDVQDRGVTTTLPDGAVTSMEYAVDTGLNALKTTVFDAEGHQKTSFTNGSSLVLRVEEEEDINTTYGYDAINQLTKVTDVNTNVILSAYDLAGRRTSITHPDAGVTKLTYDTASNMLTKQTANLGVTEKKINYTYDFNRLHEIIYPEQAQNNVTYYYGNRNASHNRVGRLTAQEDATGAQEFFYGNLGEITKVKRTVIIPNNAIATFETTWKYDTWNRLEEMVYPDQEKITYSYNTGGLLDQVSGSKTFTYNYISKLGYDKFEQRTYMKYCNGAETIYNYEPERRRLSKLLAFSGEGFSGGGTVAKFMDNNYKYDQVNNVLSVSNIAPISGEEDAMGGQMQHTYSYDNLYRLTDAKGSYIGADNKVASYTLAMGYDKLHNITSKSQHITQEGVTFDGKLSAGYDLSYNYGAKPHQIEVLEDTNYRTEGDAVRNDKKLAQAYSYDANGNVLYIAKNIAGKGDATQNERKLVWDEENRLMAVSDNGYVSLYTYDAGGERVTKQGSRGGAAHVNAAEAGGSTQTDKYTAYVNPYFVLSSGGQYTKHIMVNGQRIVSKLGDVGSFGEDPRRIAYAGDTEGISIQYGTKYTTAQQIIKNSYKALSVAYYGEDNNDYRGGEGFCCGDAKAKTDEDGITDGEDAELFQYFYHSDHLGSASYITNLDGEIAQHIEYVPFGEVFLEEKNNKWNSPYLFNGKELDEETGLVYYGARYYNPRVSNWLSVDPPMLDGRYLGGSLNLGIYNPNNLSVYAYTWQNPTRYTDPEGECPNCFTALIGGVIGGAIGGAIEAGTQLYKNGSVTDWSAVGGSVLQGGITGAAAGFTGGASLAVTASVSATSNAVGGAVNRKIQGKETSLGDVALDVTIGGVVGSAGSIAKKGLDKLSNKVKGNLGEAVTRIKYGIKGYKDKGLAKVPTGGRTPTGRVQRAHYDHKMENVITGKQITVESKFNGAGYSPNQIKAMPNVTTEGGLILSRTTSQQLGSGVSGTAAGIGAQSNSLEK